MRQIDIELLYICTYIHVICDDVTYEGFRALGYLMKETRIQSVVMTLYSNKTLLKNDQSFLTLLCPSSVVYWRQV